MTSINSRYFVSRSTSTLPSSPTSVKNLLTSQGYSTSYMSMLYDNEPFPPEDGMPDRFCCMMEQKHIDPKIRELMKSPVGRYLLEHPFIALNLMVFTAMATVPVGLFLGFGLVTFAATLISMVFIEVFLLALGGATLLCALGGLAVVAVVISFFLTACYIATSCIYKLSYRERPPEKRKRCQRAKTD